MWMVVEDYSFMFVHRVESAFSYPNLTANVVPCCPCQPTQHLCWIAITHSFTVSSYLMEWIIHGYFSRRLFFPSPGTWDSVHAYALFVQVSEGQLIPDSSTFTLLKHMVTKYCRCISLFSTLHGTNQCKWSTIICMCVCVCVSFVDVCPRKTLSNLLRESTLMCFI